MSPGICQSLNEAPVVDENPLPPDRLMLETTKASIHVQRSLDRSGTGVRRNIPLTKISPRRKGLRAGIVISSDHQSAMVTSMTVFVMVSQRVPAFVRSHLMSLHGAGRRLVATQGKSRKRIAQSPSIFLLSVTRQVRIGGRFVLCFHFHRLTSTNES